MKARRARSAAITAVGSTNRCAARSVERALRRSGDPRPGPPSWCWTQSVHVPAGVPASTTGPDPAHGWPQAGRSPGTPAAPSKALVDRSLAREQKRHQYYRHPQLVPKAGAGVGGRLPGSTATGARRHSRSTPMASCWVAATRPRSLRLVVHPFHVLCRLAAERPVVHVAGAVSGSAGAACIASIRETGSPGPKSSDSSGRSSRSTTIAMWPLSTRTAAAASRARRLSATPGPSLRCGALRQWRPSCCWTKSRTPDRHTDAGAP